MTRLVMAVLGLACLAWAQDYDVVIVNGRVMDPASGLDAVRYIGIRGDKIAAISAEALRGRTAALLSTRILVPSCSDKMKELL